MPLPSSVASRGLPRSRARYAPLVRRQTQRRPLPGSRSFLTIRLRPARLSKATKRPFFPRIRHRHPLPCPAHATTPTTRRPSTGTAMVTRISTGLTTGTAAAPALQVAEVRATYNRYRKSRTQWERRIAELAQTYAEVVDGVMNAAGPLAGLAQVPGHRRIKDIMSEVSKTAVHFGEPTPNRRRRRRPCRPEP